jgi:hypothetical protein
MGVGGTYLPPVAVHRRLAGADGRTYLVDSDVTQPAETQDPSAADTAPVVLTDEERGARLAALNSII